MDNVLCSPVKGFHKIISEYSTPYHIFFMPTHTSPLEDAMIVMFSGLASNGNGRAVVKPSWGDSQSMERKVCGVAVDMARSLWWF